MSRLGTAAALAVALLAGGCGGSQAGARADRGLDDFSCDQRRIEYLVAGGFVADEAGVSVECSNDDPRITKWHLGGGGERVSATNQLSADQFEALWSKVDSTGWRHLDEECHNPGAAEGDPVYSIEVVDHSTRRSYTCTGKELPFPYDRLVNELDLRAAGFGDADDPAR